MYYIIQENLFREFHFRTLKEYLEKYKLEYEIIEFKPFSNELKFKTKRRDVWLFGSVNASIIAKKYDWNPGSMYNENHDYSIYSKYYGENMLNSDGLILRANDKIPENIPYVFFAKPTADSKLFTGQLFTKDSYEEFVSGFDKNTKLLIAPLKTIQQELRCWIVGGKLISISQYKIGSRVVYQNQDNNEEVKIFVNKMIKLFQPARAFVMDVCLVEDDYKIIELNTINCSGFYDVNMSKLIQSIENEFNIWK